MEQPFFLPVLRRSVRVCVTTGDRGHEREPVLKIAMLYIPIYRPESPKSMKRVPPLRGGAKRRILRVLVSSCTKAYTRKAARTSRL